MLTTLKIVMSDASVLLT
uniref:Uncharacterized protein n=1 Tax=Arundo donax TaxID=35708 RepID=A0A0A9A488_ARUDO